MRICILSQQAGLAWSGVGTYCRVLAEGLARLGHEVTVLAPGGGTIPGVRVLSVGPPLPGRSHAVWLSAARRYARVAAGFNEYDVIHFADAREALLSPRSRRPRVGTVHDYYFACGWREGLSIRRYYRDWGPRYVYQRMAHYLEKVGLKRLELLICNSRAVLERVARAHAIHRSRLRVTYLAVPTEVHRGDVPVSQNPTLFFAGGNFQRKGLEVVLRAMPELTRRWHGLELRVAGRDRSGAAMARLAARLGVADQVTFLGWVSPARIRMEMRGASVFVMPSWEEGFGLVYLEAMQAGVPVVGGNVGGTRELISNGRNGFVVPAGDHRALAARLGQLIEDASLRREFVAEGFKTVATLTPRALAHATQRAYEEVLELWGR